MHLQYGILCCSWLVVYSNTTVMTLKRTLSLLPKRETDGISQVIAAIKTRVDKDDVCIVVIEVLVLERQMSVRI